MMKIEKKINQNVKDPKEIWLRKYIKLSTKARTLLQLSFQPEVLPGREMVKKKKLI